MEVYDRRIITSFVTPDDLRQIADNMEKQYKQALPGDKIEKYVLGTTEELEVNVKIDQDRADE